MSRRPRRNHTAAFKAKVAWDAIKGEKTPSELAEQFDVHANQITQWNGQLPKGATGVFGGEAKAESATATVDLKTLHAKFGELTLEIDCFGRGAHQVRGLHGQVFVRGVEVGTTERKAMIDPKHDISMQKQSSDLEISHSTVYYEPGPISAQDLWLMRRIDELHLTYPFAGLRMLRGLAVARPNQVYAGDITYIPMARGFIFLAAVGDWFSRRVLAWRLSITMDVPFCIEALEQALSKNEKPKMFNTDLGSQFASEAFTGQLKKNGIDTSMDGGGRWRDNELVQRVWKWIKYEEAYLHADETVHEVRTLIRRYLKILQFHQTASQPGAFAPDQVYFNRLPEPMAA